MTELSSQWLSCDWVRIVVVLGRVRVRRALRHTRLRRRRAVQATGPARFGPILGSGVVAPRAPLAAIVQPKVHGPCFSVADARPRDRAPAADLSHVMPGGAGRARRAGRPLQRPPAGAA